MYDRTQRASDDVDPEVLRLCRADHDVEESKRRASALGLGDAPAGPGGPRRAPAPLVVNLLDAESPPARPSATDNPSSQVGATDKPLGISAVQLSDEERLMLQLFKLGYEPFALYAAVVEELAAHFADGSRRLW